MEARFSAAAMASRWPAGLQRGVPRSRFCSVVLSESVLFSLFSVDLCKLLQDSRGRGDIFEVVFVLFCLHMEGKEVAVQAEKFLSSTVRPEGLV